MLASVTYDHRYGLATYVRETINDWRPVDILVLHNITIITTIAAKMNIQNIYKPPNVS